MSLFGRKKSDVTATTDVKSRIKLLGRSGCSNCRENEVAVRAALEELGKDIPIEHVTDYGIIATYGVMSLPAVVVDGKVVSLGKVLKKQDAVDILSSVL